MALNIRLHGTEEEIKEFLSTISVCCTVEEKSQVSDLHGNGKFFQFAKWENPNAGYGPGTNEPR